MRIRRVRSWARRSLRGLPLLPAVCLAVTGGVAIVLLATWILGRRDPHECQGSRPYRHHEAVVHGGRRRGRGRRSRRCLPAAAGRRAGAVRGAVRRGRGSARRPRCRRAYRRRVCDGRCRRRIHRTSPSAVHRRSLRLYAAALLPGTGVQPPNEACSHRNAHRRRRICPRSTRAASRIPSERQRGPRDNRASHHRSPARSRI